VGASAYVIAHRPGHPHLPPDVAPGPQSRRTRMGRGLLGCLLPFILAGGLLFGLAFLGGALVLSKIKGGPSPLPFAGAGIGGMALFWGLGFALYRGYHPRRDGTLEATVDRVRVQRGDSIRAELAAGGDGRDVELGLVCRVAYDTWSSTAADGHGRTRMTSRSIVFAQWVPAPLGEAELTVPCQGAYSHEGQSVSFAWGVYARRAGERVPSDATPIWVTP
jgi:hypothetical protein